MYEWSCMGTTRVNFRLPDDLLEVADVAAEATHKNRTEIIVEALRGYLNDIENDDDFRETVVELYLDDEVSFRVLKRVLGRQDAESVRASKTLLDEGDDLADDLAEL
jgi:metal-responsive CopG/Arc/MetJ family transcriptional regulator